MRHIRKLFSRRFPTLVSVYGVCLTLLLVLRGLVGERWLVVALLNNFLHLLLLPTLILTPIFLFRKRWRTVLSLLPGLAAFALIYGVFFVPHQVSASPAAPQVSILTYNLHYEAQAFDPMIALIREADADIVALQELSPAAAAHFAESFADQYPYQALHPNSINPIWGQGVLSKVPLLSDEYWHINLGHQRVEFQIEREQISLYNTHPVHPFFILEGRGFDTQLRAQEIASVLDRAAQDTGAVIIVGDFNMPDQSDDYRQITTRYADTYREVGWGLGLTFPDFSYANAVPDELPAIGLPIRPLVRIDYIFHSDALTAIEARVWPSSGGSDHRPVFARLALG